MSNEIQVPKNVVLILAGLVIILCGYIVFGNTINGNNVSLPCSQNNGTCPTANQTATVTNGQFQEVYLKASGLGYDKSEITVRKNMPVRLHFTAQNAGCGSQLVVYGLGVSVISRGTENTVEFIPNKEGVYEFNCGMKMFPAGRFVVTG